jgi:hypothetical protein
LVAGRRKSITDSRKDNADFFKVPSKFAGRCADSNAVEGCWRNVLILLDNVGRTVLGRTVLGRTVLGRTVFAGLFGRIHIWMDLSEDCLGWIALERTAWNLDRLGTDCLGWTGSWSGPFFALSWGFGRWSGFWKFGFGLLVLEIGKLVRIRKAPD